MAPTTTCSCPCCCFAPTTTADRSSQGPTRLLSNDFGIKRPTTFRHSSRESVSTGCPPDTSGRGNPLYVAISCRLHSIHWRASASQLTLRSAKSILVRLTVIAGSSERLSHYCYDWRREATTAIGVRRAKAALYSGCKPSASRDFRSDRPRFRILAADFRCWQILLQKSPKCAATNFPPKDGTSDNRRSMCSQSRHRDCL